MSLSTFLIILCALFFIMIIVMAFIYNGQIKKLDYMINDISSERDSLKEQVKKLKCIEKIKSDNRRETNEKLNNLHTGDAVNSAIDILCNKNNN